MLTEGERLFKCGGEVAEPAYCLLPFLLFQLFSFELAEDFLGIGEGVFGYPCGFVHWVAFPFDKPSW